MFSLQHGIVKKEHWYILCVCFVYTCRYNKTFVFDACVCVCVCVDPISHAAQRAAYNMQFLNVCTPWIHNRFFSFNFVAYIFS